MRTPARRLGAVALATALVTGTALAATPAQAANYYGQTASGWLAGQLTGGVAHNDQFDFDDYGLSLDTFFALRALGTRPAAAASVLDRLDDDPNAYIEFDGETFAGSVGKLATAVHLQGRNPRSFGGVNLVQRLEQRVHTADDAQRGRATDGPGSDFSNAIGQSFVVRGLAGARSPLADEAAAFLLQQQCSAGFFREGLTSSDGSYDCDGGTSGERAPSVDATGFAVQALVEARAAGVTGLDDDISRAAGWLVAHQRADGSFVGNGTANTNTTGLAAAALALTGHRARAEHAGAWIARRVVTDAVAAGSPKLAREVGAIAYDDAALTDGKQAGIPVEARDQWRRATARAVIGVNVVKSLRVTAPAGYLHGGGTITVGATGLAAGERFWFRLGDATRVRGVGTAGGVASARLTLPRATRTYQLQGFGLSSTRTGRAPVAVLGPRTFGTRLQAAPIKAGRTQRVTVTGLASREPVSLTYGGRSIWSGRAPTSGALVHAFAVGRSLGKKTLAVHGRFDDRRALTYFRVVR